ncbi:MAG TPA: hypothetical protein VNA69_12740 [Thermoanaerobaculia bacterium]|nr:hypothetical protein [Thermoanaerobaculia bacterium]
MIAAAIGYLIVGRAGARLRPRLVAMELASTLRHASNVLLEWQQGRQMGRAIITVALDMIHVVVYAVALVTLLVAIGRPEGIPPAIYATNALVMLGVAFAALANWAEDILMLVMLGTRKAYSFAVFWTRFLGWCKYALMALLLVYLIFRGEVYLYEFLNAVIKRGHWMTIAWLTATMVLLAFLVARRLSMFSQQHAPLLSLQLARDRLTAKTILEQWGRRGRRNAAITLGLQSLFALLYGITLAILCRRIEFQNESLQMTAGAMAWLAIIAASFHVAQNLGAFIAVNRGDMGWWVGVMRRVGRMRIALLGLVGFYFVALAVYGEWTVLAGIARWVDNITPDISLPWS